MRTALVVIGSPSPSSFVHALAHEVTTALMERGVEVDKHDLYTEGFHPVADSTETSTARVAAENATAATADPLIRAHRHALTRADYLVAAHPNWWGKPPAIMAGWIDRVIVPGIAYRLDTRDGLPTPLLHLRGIIVLNTGDTTPEREADVFGDPLDAIWRRCVGAYLGDAPIHRLLVGPLGGSAPDQRQAWLSHARTITEKA